jgi:RHS repeat-associated protein
VKAVYSDAQRTQLKAKFTYDDRGKRLLKENYANGNTVTERAWYLNDAAGSLVAQVRADGNGNTQRTEHPVTGAQRIGFYDRSGAGSMRYELTDHLGNVRVGLVVTNGQVIMAEAHDYYPHGMPMPGRNTTSPAAGAYAYQGKENMTATGMLDFDLRNYDAQLGRWVVCDPMMQHFSPYLAMGNNPVMGVDPTGGYTGYIGGEYYQDISNQQANSLRADQFFQESQQRFNAQTGQGNEYASFGPSGGLNADGTSRDMSGMIFQAGANYARCHHDVIEQGGELGFFVGRRVPNSAVVLVNENGESISGLDEYEGTFVSSYWLNNGPGGSAAHGGEHSFVDGFGHFSHSAHGAMIAAEGSHLALELLYEHRGILGQSSFASRLAPRVGNFLHTTNPFFRRLPLVGVGLSAIDVGKNVEANNSVLGKKAAELAFHTMTATIGLAFPGVGTGIALILEVGFYYGEDELINWSAKLD